MVIAIVRCVCGCGPPAPIKNEPHRAPGEQTLYERLGGGPAVTAIVDNWVERAVRDPRVNFARQGHPHNWMATADSLAQLKIYWTQYVGVLADGPQIYEGRDMLTTHTGMEISEGEWLALMEDLKQTLDAFKFPLDQQQELMQRVAGAHDVIVNK